MASRKLWELLLVVLTLNFTWSNEEKLKCLKSIQNDAYAIIRNHLPNYGLSCEDVKHRTKNFTCILKWTLAENCTQFQGVQKLIRESSEKCEYKPLRQPPLKCSKEYFLKCWCGFISKKF